MTIALVALLLSAVFASLHLSLRTLVRTRLAEMAEEHPSAAARRRVGKILEDVDGHSLALGLPRIVCNLIVVVAAVFWIAAVGGPESADPDAVTPAPTVTHMAVGLVVSSLALWIVGFVVPSSIAQHAGERWVFRFSPLARLLYVLLRPVEGLVGLLDEIVRRLTGASRADEAEAIEAELLSVVQEGRQEGQFDAEEQDMIEAVVEFRSTTVEEIMTPRTEVRALEYTDDLESVKSFVRDGGHSRIPVFSDNLDHLKGVLYAKDLLRWMSVDHGDEAFSLAEILRPAVFVPETKTVRELMRELLAQKVHISMVIDEYGGTAGLVTIEDIVEEIFGEIQDEYEDPDRPDPDIAVDEKGQTATIDARMRIDDANDELQDIRLAIPEHGDYDTVGGFVTVTLGRIPLAGERFAANGLTVEILEAEPTRVKKVAVRATPVEVTDSTSAK